MAIKYFCDTCFEESENLHRLEILCHVTAKNQMETHVTMHKGKTQGISRRHDHVDMCISCYNEFMYPLWEEIEKKQTATK